MPRFTPLNEDEIKKLGLLPDGRYRFKVIGAEDVKSKNTGAEMIKLKLGFDINGRLIHVFDHLLFEGKMLFKTMHFCYGAGLNKEYDEGHLFSHHCVGKEGECDIVIQKGQPKPDGGFYDDKNAVQDYVKLELTAPGDFDSSLDEIKF